MKPLSHLATSTRRSGIREIMDLAAHVPDVIHLEVGEPNFPTPAHIIAAGERALHAGWTKYTPNAGIPPLRAAIAAKMQVFNHVDCAPEQIVVTAGSTVALMTTMLALLNPGDEVLVPDPGFPNYLGEVLYSGGRPVPYPLRIGREWLPDAAELEAAVTPAAKVLVLNSPSNPTGAVLPRPLVEALVDFARRHDLYIVSDEVYEAIIFEGEHVSPAALAPERTITISGFSKAYAMTGWRLGYAVAPPEIAPVITKLQEPVTSCATAFSQVAAEAALRGPQDCVRAMRDEYHARRDAAIAVMRRHGLYRYTPHGAFYLLVDIRASGEEATPFCRRLIETARVAVAPGDTFGACGAGWVRVSLATELSLLVEGLERLCRAIRQG